MAQRAIVLILLPRGALHSSGFAASSSSPPGAEKQRPQPVPQEGHHVWAGSLMEKQAPLGVLVP